MRLWSGLLLGLAVATASAGCEGSNSSMTNPAPLAGVTTPAWSIEGSQQPPAPPIPGAGQGGTVTVLASESSLFLDPTDAYYADSAAVDSNLLVRSLTQHVYDPASGRVVLLPDLATTLGWHNADYTVWKYTLRRGIRFENGQPVTPQEVKFGIERSFDRTTFPDGATYSNDYFLDGATYHGPYRSRRPYQGVTISGRTLTLRMAQPFPDMPWWASWPAMGPIPLGSASNPATYKNHPWATGPYKIASYIPSKSLVLVRNRQWDPDTDPGRHQYVDKWVFHLDLRTGVFHQLLPPNARRAQSTLWYDKRTVLTGPQITRFQRTEPAELVTGTQPCTTLLYPDTRKITDVNVRRALAYAYPYRAALRVQGKVLGVTAQFATTLMTPGAPGRQPYNPVPGHPPGSTQPAKARALLQRADALGFPIRFAYPADVAASRSFKNLMVSALRRAGFDPQPVRSTEQHLDSDYLVNERADVNLRVAGWCSDWPTGTAWVRQIFGGSSQPSGSQAGVGDEGNFEYFFDAAVDARIARVERLSLKAQPRAWSATERWIQTTYLPVIPTSYRGEVMAHGLRVHDDYYDPIYLMPTFQDIWLG